MFIRKNLYYYHNYSANQQIRETKIAVETLNIKKVSIIIKVYDICSQNKIYYWNQKRKY